MNYDLIPIINWHELTHDLSDPRALNSENAYHIAWGGGSAQHENGQTCARYCNRITDSCESEGRDGRASVSNDIGGAYRSNKTQSLGGMIEE